MKRTLMMTAATAAAAALFAPDTGSASGAANADPINKSDPAPRPQAGDPNSASASPDPQPGAVGNAPDADPSPPSTAKAADKASAKAGERSTKRMQMVWAQPGHEKLGLGQLIDVPNEVGETLRAAGRARYASEAEVKAGKDQAIKLDSV